MPYTTSGIEGTLTIYAINIEEENLIELVKGGSTYYPAQ